MSVNIPTYNESSTSNDYCTPPLGVDLFLESIKSEATRRSYKQSLRHFERDTGFGLSESTQAPDLQKALIGYIVTLKHKGKSYSRINGIVSALQKYCEAFDIEIKFKKVRRYMPEHEKTVQDCAYSKQEIQTLVENSNPRVKALIWLIR